MKNIRSSPAPPVVGENGRDALQFENWPISVNPSRSLIDDGFTVLDENAAKRPPMSNRRFGSEFFGLAGFDLPPVSVSLLHGWTATIDSLRLQWDYPDALPVESASYSRDTGLIEATTVKNGEFAPALSVIWSRLDVSGELLPWSSHSYDCSYKIGKYAQQITYTDETGGTATVMLGLYSSRTRVPVPVVVLDVNPAKCSPRLFSWCLRCCSRGASSRCEVKRYDLAYDMPIPRNCARILDVKGRRNVRYKEEDETQTEYLGRKNHPGYVKLYDKAAELGLTGDLTRLEFTLARDSTIPQMLEPCIIDQEWQQTTEKVRFDVLACCLYPDLIPLLKERVCADTWTRIKRQIMEYHPVFWRLDPDSYIAVQRHVRAWISYLEDNF